METQRRLMLISESNRARIEVALKAHELNGERTTGSESGDSSSQDSDSDEGSVSGAGGEKSENNNHAGLVVQIDDEADEDLVLFLEDNQNSGFQMCNLESLPTDLASPTYMNSQMVTMITQKTIKGAHHPNRQLSDILKSMYQDLAFQGIFPNLVTKLSYSIRIPTDLQVQVCLTAVIYGQNIKTFQEIAAPGFSRGSNTFNPALNRSGPVPGTLQKNGDDQVSLRSMENDDENLAMQLGNSSDSELGIDTESINLVTQVSTPPPNRESATKKVDARTSAAEGTLPGTIPLNHIEITPSSRLPSHLNLKPTIDRFLGRISLHFIKETHLVFDIPALNGMGGFTAKFMLEIGAVARAHAKALGGDSICNYTVDQSLFLETINQGYALVSVSGDVMFHLYE